MNAVAPGYIATNLANAGGPASSGPATPLDASAFPNGHIPQPGDYAGIYTFLASNAATSITGATLLADWGSSLRR